MGWEGPWCAGAEVLKEPCDPRDPEYGAKCAPKLPRLPQDRTDPFDPRSGKNAPRRGSVLGLNDLNIEQEDDFKNPRDRGGGDAGGAAQLDPGFSFLTPHLLSGTFSS